MFSLASAIKAIALVCYLVLALLTLRSTASRRVRVFFSIYLFGMLFWQLGSLAINFTEDPGKALLLYNLMIASSASYTILFFQFTRALVDIQGQKVLAGISYAACVLQFLSAIMGLQLDEVRFGRSGYWIPVYSSNVMFVLSGLSFGFWGLGFHNLLKAFLHEASPVKRNRYMYIMLGAAVTIIGASTNLTRLRDFPVDISANLASALIIGYAVVRHRLMDIRSILVRSLFYSILTASLIAIYLVVIITLERFLAYNVGYARPQYGIMPILVLAILFLPIRNTMQSVLDKVFFRKKEDYQSATQAFSRSIATLYDPEPVLDLIGNTISRSVKTQSISIFLFDSVQNAFILRRTYGKDMNLEGCLDQGSHSLLFKWLKKEGKILHREELLLDPESLPLVEESGGILKSDEVSLIVPILLNEQLIGILAIGQKLAGTMYNNDDLSFLATIANQTASALDKCRIFLGIRRRLSEQTLLFILSEKFRSSTDFDSAMSSIVGTLKNFLNCEQCAILYLDRTRELRCYYNDPASASAARLVEGFLEKQVERYVDITSHFIQTHVKEALAATADIKEPERLLLESLMYTPLEHGGACIGVLILSRGRGSLLYDAQEEELHNTIRAILSQGIVLHRTIMDLMRVESYNEKILNSLNDMGDTLLIVDREGLIKRTNQTVCTLLEYEKDELQGLDIDFVISSVMDSPDWSTLLDMLEHGPISNMETFYRSHKGTLTPMLISGSVMPNETGEGEDIIFIARDMTERRKAETASKNLLLLQEIHHRIKNNLQVISSLLYLQARYVKDPDIKNMFKDSQNRIRSMAMIHEKLYRSETPSTINFSDYISDLIRSLVSSYNLQTANIGLKVEVSDISLGMDTAVPCGLIINELVSNALKHAFPDDSHGHITVSLKGMDIKSTREDDAEWLPGYELMVMDDGKGLPDGIDLENPKTLGLTIVNTLTSQLHGKLEMRHSSGTQFLITFRELPDISTRMTAEGRQSSRPSPAAIRKASPS